MKRQQKQPLNKSIIIETMFIRKLTLNNSKIAGTLIKIHLHRNSEIVCFFPCNEGYFFVYSFTQAYFNFVCNKIDGRYEKNLYTGKC